MWIKFFFRSLNNLVILAIQTTIRFNVSFNFNFYWLKIYSKRLERNDRSSHKSTSRIINLLMICGIWGKAVFNCEPFVRLYVVHICTCISITVNRTINTWNGWYFFFFCKYIFIQYLYRTVHVQNKKKEIPEGMLEPGNTLQLFFFLQCCVYVFVWFNDFLCLFGLEVKW